MCDKEGLRMFTDSHNHTSEFSGDAHMTAPELFAAAKSRNLSAVVITEHYEMDYPHKLDTPLLFDVDSYFESFSKWAGMIHDGLHIYSGIELGYQPHLCGFYNNLIARYPFDSVIMSNHLYKGQDPYFFPECYKSSKSEVFSSYIDELTQMVISSDDFDIVGHFDYIMRYSTYNDPTMRYSDASGSFDKFLQALVYKKKSLEVNTRSINKLLSKNISNYWPDRDILERYIALGGERVTLGSDSHDPSTLGFYFDETAAYLKSCGFRELTTYVKRKEIRTPIL